MLTLRGIQQTVHTQKEVTVHTQKEVCTCFKVSNCPSMSRHSPDMSICQAGVDHTHTLANTHTHNSQLWRQILHTMFLVFVCLNSCSIPLSWLRFAVMWVSNQLAIHRNEVNCRQRLRNWSPWICIKWCWICSGRAYPTISKPCAVCLDLCRFACALTHLTPHSANSLLLLLNIYFQNL